jgi:uncharacterized protein (DUF1684 family)
VLAVCAALLLSISCARPSTKADGGSYEKEIEQWRAERLSSLKSDDGWLTLVGLFWLKEGGNKFGSDPSGDIVLPAGKAPASAGSLWLKDGAVRLEARQGVEITHEGKPVSTLDLRSDDDEKPTVLSLGTLSFHVIKRGDRFGLRVKDRENPARLNFGGLQYFPLNDKWRVAARFERFDPPKSISITNVLGMEEQDPSPGTIVFEVGGQTYRLDALSEKGEEKLFIIFADATSGKETYGAGRYLYADPPDASGKLIVDFNKAYSPPCAFTSYATCPLPPFQNRLPVSVDAGEKYAGH